MLTRRHFLATSTAAFAANLFGAPKDAKTPPPELEKLGAVALREAKKYKATYCDIRIVRLRDQRIGLRVQSGRGGTVSVPNVGEDSTFGFGVRVIVNGAWGFASSPDRHARGNRAHHWRSRHRRQGQRQHPAQTRATRRS